MAKTNKGVAKMIAVVLGVALLGTTALFGWRIYENYTETTYCYPTVVLDGNYLQQDYNYADPIKVRGRTADRSPHTFMIDMQLGYLPGDEKTAAELDRRQQQLLDLLRQYLSSQKVVNMTPEREDTLKAELRNQINNILTQGRVTDVIFTEKVVDFG
jgi:flagellar protein FliL